jgi:hypothetical protein
MNIGKPRIIMKGTNISKYGEKHYHEMKNAYIISCPVTELIKQFTFGKPIQIISDEAQLPFGTSGCNGYKAQSEGKRHNLCKAFFIL